MSFITDDEASSAWKTWKAHNGNARKAAKALGMSETSFRRRLERGTARGLDTQGPILSPGLLLAGKTTLYKDGEQQLQWVRELPEKSLENVVQALKETFDEYKGKAGSSIGVPISILSHKLLTVYPIADMHLGMYSWKEETGEDYDLEIASALLTSTMGNLMSVSYPSSTAIILNLGDFFHSDSNDNRTRKSGNVLDVDTRYAKVLRTGVRLLINTISMALSKHERVIVRNLQGNHDPYAALALTVALDAYYTGEDRVEVDVSPSPFWFYKHGKVLLGATHGDMAKPADMVSVMAAKEAVAWGQTLYRYLMLGHVHQKNKGGEVGGATWETFQTITPKDAWANSMGFTPGRSMQSITFDENLGEVARFTIAVKGAE